PVPSGGSTSSSVGLFGSPPKDALHLDGTRADPFLTASGKPVVLIFVRTDCPISNRYAPLIQRISSEYGGKVAVWLVYPSRTSTAEKIRQHEHEYGYLWRCKGARAADRRCNFQTFHAPVAPGAAGVEICRRTPPVRRANCPYSKVGRARSCRGRSHRPASRATICPRLAARPSG